MKKRILIFLCFFFIGIIQICFARHPDKDSLLRVLKTAKEDTNKTQLLNDLSEVLMQSNLDTSIMLSSQALVIAEKVQWKKGIAASYIHLGVFFYTKGDFILALENFNKCIVIYEQLKSKKGEARVLGNIAGIYASQGDYPKALEYHFKSLKMLEGTGDKEAIRAFLTDIGITYTIMGDYSKALTYSFQALKMAEEAGDKHAFASEFENIGNVYKNQGDFPKALEYLFRALKISGEIGNRHSLAGNLISIATIYSAQGDSASAKKTKSPASSEKYAQALEYAFKALKIYQELGDKTGIETALGHIGIIYRETGKFKEAEDYLGKAITISDSIGALDHLREYEEGLSRLYDNAGRYKMAFEHYKKAVVIKDKLFSQQKNKEITRKEMNYEFSKKEELTKVEQDKKDTVAQGEIQKQKQLKYSFVSGLGLVILLMFLSYRTYRARQILRLQSIRNKISGDLHDDIGSTLNSISIYSEVARKKDEQQDEALEMIGDASRKIIDAMSDIVWTINPDNDSFAKIIFRMKSLAYNLFRAKNIEFTFHSDETLDEKKLSLEERRNFYLIFKEATNNLVKYSNAVRVVITLTNENGSIKLSIKDDGVGFVMSEDITGNGLKNMKRRADEIKARLKIESSKGNGTQLELILKA
jgi:two-component system sensor histidine kinase UhpB